jgi:hypothetical protein
MIVDHPKDHPYVAAFAIAFVLIVGVLVISVAWPDMLPGLHGRRVASR